MQKSSIVIVGGPGGAGSVERRKAGLLPFAGALAGGVRSPAAGLGVVGGVLLI
jgi:hypothetical protein